MMSLNLAVTGDLGTPSFPVIVTTPKMVREDFETFEEMPYKLIVVDEGLRSDYL